MVKDNDTLAQSVAAALRQALVDGVYGPGERLIELGIAQEMGVSQNTARDALHLLEREGWIVRRARHGATVRSFTATEAEEHYALWAAVSALALGWAITDVPRGRLVRALQTPIGRARTLLLMDRMVDAPIRAALFEFHEAIGDAVEQAGKAQTARLMVGLRNGARLMETALPPAPLAYWTERVAAYEQLLGVIKFGDVEAAQQAIRARILHESERLRVERR
jgi:DNA-binding GntR family transcriptional regulator